MNAWEGRRCIVGVVEHWLINVGVHCLHVSRVVVRREERRALGRDIESYGCIINTQSGVKSESGNNKFLLQIAFKVPKVLVH